MTTRKPKLPERKVILDKKQIEAIGLRLRRAHGQLGAVVRMLEEGQSCNDIVVQMAAVSKAINTAAFTLISENLKNCLLEDKESASDATQRLQKLFLSLA